MLNVSAKWQRAVMLDNDINVNCFADIVTTNGEKIPVSDSELWANGFEVNDSTSSNGTSTLILADLIYSTNRLVSFATSSYPF